MARRCSVTKKAVKVGNNVSHANNKNKRRFLPNLHSKRFMSDILGQMVRLRVSSNGLRTIESNGGLDAFMLKAKPAQLEPKALAVKRRIENRLAKTKAAS